MVLIYQSEKRNPSFYKNGSSQGLEGVTTYSTMLFLQPCFAVTVGLITIATSVVAHPGQLEKRQCQATLNNALVGYFAFDHRRNI